MKTKVPMDGYQKAEPVNASFEEISKLASELAKFFDYKIGGDIKKVVNNLGGEIVYREYDDIISSDDGAITVDGPGKFKISLPNFTGPLRDRFTIAHEIGHYVLHSFLGEKKIKVARFNSGPITDQTEWEANWFAAGFLMPEKTFKRDYKKNPLLEMIAAKYLVSIDTARARVRQLGLK